MKVSILVKLFVSAVLCGFLFVGCGSGAGESSDTGGTGNGTGGEEPPPDSGTNIVVIDYYSIENNITEATNGLFYLRNHPLTTENIRDNGTYLKTITYYGVPSNIATKLYSYLTESVWIDTPCESVWYGAPEDPIYCAAFVATSGVNLPANVSRAVVGFNGDDDINCGSGTCDISLSLNTHSNDYTMETSGTIQKDDFKNAFISGADASERKTVLNEIENSAQSVTVQISKYFGGADYTDGKYIIQEYTDQLKVNYPNVFAKDGDGATLTYKDAAIYNVRNTFNDSENVAYSRFSVSGTKINLNW
ncbi:MAG: hypothetical protein LBF71_01765 [Campylobacteraceae bacterium]|jgi:hypothetical protein|nr:hypothetical protein [Campylobacteraceae bacterium]